MYILNEQGKEKLSPMKFNYVARVVGITPQKLSKIVKDSEPCMKLTAYCLTKFIDSEKEIVDFFDRIGEQ